MSHVVCLFIFLSLTVGHATRMIPDNKKEMNRLIKEEKKELTRIKFRELSLLKKIDQLQNDIFKSDKELVRIKFQLKERHKLISSLKQELNTTDHSISQQKMMIALIANKIHRLYGQNKTPFMESMFNSKDFMNLRRNLKLSEIFISSYYDLIEKLDQNNEKRKNKIDMISASTKDLQLFQEQESSLLQQRKEKKTELLALLEKIENEKTTHLKYLSELHTAQRKLDAKISRLKYQRYQLSGLNDQKGQLLFPLPGRITQRYGRQINKRFKTILFNKGIVIQSNIKKRVRCVADGVVVFSDWFKGYGNMIIVNHGSDYYSLYANTSRILKKKNEKVKRGDYIAIAGIDSHGKQSLYFELRHLKKTLDPLKWLNN